MDADCHVGVLPLLAMTAVVDAAARQRPRLPLMRVRCYNKTARYPGTGIAQNFCL